MKKEKSKSEVVSESTKKAKCPVCGSTNIEPETKDVARCKKCGHLISI